MLFLAVILATTQATYIENPRFVSPNGEKCLVVRRFPRIGDFGAVEEERYREMVEDTEPNGKRPRAALYRLWPGEYRQLLTEIDFEPHQRVLVTDDGQVVTYGRVSCEREADLLTIYGDDGTVARTIRGGEVLTWNDRQWICRGSENDVSFSIDRWRGISMTVMDAQCDEADGRHHAVQIDLAGREIAKPERDRCPAALKVVVETDEALPRHRVDRDVVPITGQELLDRTVARVLPDYPVVATKARISGRVGVQVVVGKEGRVEWAMVVKPLPFGLDEAVRRAIEKWELTPNESRVSAVLVFRFEIVRNYPVVTTH